MSGAQAESGYTDGQHKFALVESGRAMIKKVALWGGGIVMLAFIVMVATERQTQAGLQPARDATAVSGSQQD